MVEGSTNLSYTVTLPSPVMEVKYEFHTHLSSKLLERRPKPALHKQVQPRNYQIEVNFAEDTLSLFRSLPRQFPQRTHCRSLPRSTKPFVKHLPVVFKVPALQQTLTCRLPLRKRLPQLVRTRDTSNVQSSMFDLPKT